VDAESTTDPREQTIDHLCERQNCDHDAEDLAYHDEAKNGTLGVSMQSIYGSVLGVRFAAIDNNATSRNWLVRFWDPDLADSDGRRDTHHRSRDKVLSRHTQADVYAQYGASDSRKSLNGSTLVHNGGDFLAHGKHTGCHDKMNFRLGHDVDVWFHQTSRFTLTDEWRRSSGDSFSTRYIHGLEEKPSRVLDDPLHNAEIIKQFHKGNEENESWELSR
jgi:hypothetical protein